MTARGSHALRVAFVVAAAENGVIGRDGGLPWRLSSDLKYFRRMTLGKPMIMGRKTFQSIGKPLDGRDSIVLTRQSSYSVPAGVDVVHTPEAALARARERAEARGVDEVAVIGGAEVYRLMLPHADRLYLTRVHAEPEGNATLAVDPEMWEEAGREEMTRTAKDDHAATFITYERRR